MAVLSRILLILMAFLVACLTATVVMTVAIMVRGVIATSLPVPPLSEIDILIGPMTLVGRTMLVVMAALAFVPTLLVATVSEIYRLRSMLFYAVAGGVVGIVCQFAFALVYFSFLPKGLPRPTLIFPSYLSAVAAGAGIVAGMVYWAIAGRNAGRWRESRI